jgi:hypothetical protein
MEERLKRVLMSIESPMSTSKWKVNLYITKYEMSEGGRVENSKGTFSEGYVEKKTKG